MTATARLWAATLLALILTTLLGLSLTTPLAADETDGTTLLDVPISTVALELTELTPAVPALNDQIRTYGTLTNLTGSPLEDVRIRYRVSHTALYTREDVRNASEGSSQLEGMAVSDTTITLSLAPGQSTTFELAAGTEQLQLSRDDTQGVYLLGVEVLDSQYQRLDLERTFIPWYPRPEEVRPSSIVWLWPISSIPTIGAAGEPVQPTTDFTRSGRLTSLLNVAKKSKLPLTWLLDPQTLESAPDSWLTQLREVATGEVYALPYAVADGVALQRADAVDLMYQAAAEAPAQVAELLGSSVSSETSSRTGRFAGARKPADVLGTVLWPVQGYPGKNTMRSWFNAGIESVVLPEASMPTEQEYTYTPPGLGLIDVENTIVPGVLLDQSLAQAFTEPNPVLARQRILAETVMITAQEPSLPRTVALGFSLDWNPDAKLLTQLFSILDTASWIQIAPLSQLLEAEAPAREQPVSAEAEKDEALSSQYINTLLQDSARVDQLQDLTQWSDDEPLIRQLRDTIQRAPSSLLRGESTLQQRLLQSIDTVLQTQTDKLTVLAADDITLASDIGLVPLTIANDFDMPVTIGVTANAESTTQVRVEDIEPMVIQPREKRSVQLPVQIIGATDIPVDIYLQTPDGAFFGTPTHINIRSAAYTRAAGWVIAGAGIMLVGFLSVGMIKRIAQARRS